MHRTLIRMGLLIVVLANLLGLGCDEERDNPWDPRFDEFAAALEDDLEKSTAYGVSVAVMEDGVVTFAHAFGAKDKDGDVPLTPETLMQIGSTTKQMTAVALLQKVEAGHATLDDALEQLLPELEFELDGTWDDQITLHHLLSHQSGLVEKYDLTGPSDDDELARWTYDVYDDEYYVMNPAGAFWNYSNTGFSLAGLVTEELDERYWPDIMVEDVFEPLGMNRTFARKVEVEQDGDYALSSGVYDFEQSLVGHVTMEDMADPPWVRPAGMVWSTPSQMMQWAEFLMNGNNEVLSDSSLEALQSKQVDILSPANNMHYGYGLFVGQGLSVGGQWFDIPHWFHGGATGSFTNEFFILPESNFAVAICSSGWHADFSSSLAAAIESLAKLPSPSEAPRFDLDWSTFDRHVGTYDDPFGYGEVEVALDGKTLVVDAPGITELGATYERTLMPITNDIFNFYVEGVPLLVTFIPQAQEQRSQYIRTRESVFTLVESTQ